MKKLLFSVIFFSLLIFSFSIKVYAECSYSERSQLLNEANKVDIYFEPAEKVQNVTAVNPNTGESNVVKETIIYLKMNFANVSDNIFIKVVNKNNNESFVVNSDYMVNDLYSLDLMDIDNIVDYSVTFYSNSNNCYASSINSKTYKKPRINLISEYLVCDNEIVANSKYCKRFIDSEFSMSEYEIVEYLNKKINEASQFDEEVPESLTFIDLIQKYWYVPTLIGVLFVISIVLIIVKKRGELK